MRSGRSSLLFVATTAFALLTIALQCQTIAEAGIVVTVEAPKAQSTSVAAATTEAFDSSPLGGASSLSTAVGTFTSPNMIVKNADLFGGAGRTGRYMSLTGMSSGQVSMTLALDAFQSYIGFWWAAADPGNVVELYSGTTLLGTFNSAIALSQLSSSYNGNPNPPGGNIGEKYAYLNFFATDGSAFNRVVFRQLNSSGFEMDNISIRSDPVEPPLPGTEIPGSIVVTTPEPSTIVGSGLGGFILTAVRRRHRARGR